MATQTHGNGNGNGNGHNAASVANVTNMPPSIPSKRTEWTGAERNDLPSPGWQERIKMTLVEPTDGSDPFVELIQLVRAPSWRRMRPGQVVVIKLSELDGAARSFRRRQSIKPPKP